MDEFEFIDRDQDEFEFYNNPINMIESTQISYIETLLKHSNLDHDQREVIEREMSSYSAIEANECIAMLNDKQLDPITSGFNYSQSDISKKIG